MLSLQMLQILQTGLKFFFDVDPCLTEHLVRNMLSHMSAISRDAADLLRNSGAKAGDILAPVVQDLRSIRLGSIEL